MPLESASPTPAAASRSWFRSVLRTTWVVLQIAIVTFCVLLLAVRYIVFPRIESNRDELTRMLSRQVGAPVAIESLRTGWDGWNPRLDIDGFRVLNPENGVSTVTLPHVRLVAAWTSLVVMELRLRMLALSPGECFRLTARDPGAPEDLPSWCRMTGHRLVQANHPQYLIERRKDP